MVRRRFFYVVLGSLVTLHFSLYSVKTCSQDDSAFEQIRKAMDRQFKAFADQNQQEYDRYVEEIDAEFAAYLKQAWQDFALYAGVRPDTTPKPNVLPRFTQPATRMTPKQLSLAASSPAPVTLPPVPTIPVPLKTVSPDAIYEPLSLDFYGTSLAFDIDPTLITEFSPPFSNEKIGDYWETISQGNYTSLVNQLKEAGNRLNLNDWGYFLLVNRLTMDITPTRNSSRMLAWYLLTKSGYKIRIGYSGDLVYLLFPAANLIYGMKYFLIDQVRYYAPDFPLDKVATYGRDFPEANRIMDLNIHHALNIGEDYAERPFNLTYMDRECSFSVKYNLNAVEFYKDYPLCELNVYFNATVSPELKESLLFGLQPYLENLSDRSKVGFLLNFVQNGFPYKTDPEQFNGAEKFFFPEEDFYYPFSDCDDRAVLFAYLVRELTGLKVIGVEYPGHVATAVHFNEDVEGDFLIWQNEKYVIADPTYIDAPVGMTMTGMINEKAQIIDLVNGQSTSVRYANVWEKVGECGGKPGDNRQTVATDDHGNSYVTGYFSGTAHFGSTTLNSIKGQNDIFVAAFDPAGIPLWASQAGGDRSDLGYNIAADRDGNLYVTGSFHGTIAFGDKSLKAPAYTDLFMAKYTPSGKLLWVNQAGLDTTNETSDYIFVASFTPEGKRLSTRLYPEDENFTHSGISFDPSGNVYYTASYTSTVGLNIDMIWLSAGADFNLLTTLKTELDKQLSNKCEKTIAGLFAAISLIRIDNISLSGKTVQSAFTTYNPNFRQTAPKVFETLGKVDFVKNNQGIVTVHTLDEEPVLLDKIKINHNARLKATMLPSGDAKIEILEGVKVGKAFIWFSLNYMKLFRINGDVLFDYDDDHSQKTLNMKKDMLF